MYADNSLAVFNGRPYVGILYSSNGAQIWKKTVTADYSVSNTTIKPGVMVSFTNTSVGDVITSAWKFGDGGSLTGQVPQVVTHTYVSPGAYTVTLMVNDGVDTNTVTRMNYIQVGYRLYMPVALVSSAMPSMTLYDDFSDTAFDGFYNPLKWRTYNQSNNFSIQQLNGSLMFSNTVSTPGQQGYDIQLSQPPARNLRQIQEFESRLKISSDHSGGWSDIHMFIESPDVNGHGWWTQCGLGAGYSATQPLFGCDVHIYNGNVYTSEFNIPQQALSFNTWYTIRIEVNPCSGQFSYYLNNSFIGSYTPNDATTLINLNSFDLRIGLWNGDPNSTATRYVDDVKVTPANQ